jgi:hypothetical protein
MKYIVKMEGDEYLYPWTVCLVTGNVREYLRDNQIGQFRETGNIGYTK